MYRLIILAMLLTGCKSFALKTTEKGKCVRIDKEWAYFEIEYNCKMKYPCIKSAMAKNRGKFQVGKVYRLTQVR